MGNTGKTVSIEDDALGVRATVRFEETDAGPRIAWLHFDAVDGHGVDSTAMRGLLEHLDLPIPAAPAAPATPAVEAAPGKAPAKRAPAKRAPAKKATPGKRAPGKKATPAAAPAPAPAPAAAAAVNGAATAVDGKHDVPQQRRPYFRGGPPPAHVLLTAAGRPGYAGTLPALAEEFGAHRTTVSKWLRAARAAAGVSAS